ncbi:solute carrier family 25 member 43-like [Saccostrea echinata]|uniref:solute carrier family 25 member 43-like n=1 Tax=Saccostrea echinata TaxID=191078 RepID=UPI002A820109|nr:solute carrier family 25 member 43-like [Saccostrea echinata]
MWTSDDHRITYLQNFLCGSVAGVLSRTITSPLDVLKIVCEVKGSKMGLLSVSKHIYAVDGGRGFFRGNFIACVKIFPYSAVQVWSYRKFRRYISDDLGRLSISGSVSAATLSVLTATTFTYPLDLIKTRLVIQQGAAYKSIAHAAFTIIKTEGPRTLYNGLWPTLWGTILYAFCTFLTYEALDSLWWDRRLRPIELVLQGSAASSLVITVTFPFDLIRKRMQAKSSTLPYNGGVGIPFSNVRTCVINTVAASGVKGLWQGLLPAIIRTGPYHASMYIFYDMCKTACLYRNGYISNIDQNIDLEELQETADYDVDFDIELQDE